MNFRVAHGAAAIAAAILVTSCGGGDDSSPTPPPPPPPPPSGITGVTLSATSVDVVVREGAPATFGFDATYTGSSADPVVADIVVDARRYRLKGAPTASGQTFTVDFETIPFPVAGRSNTDVTFRLCKTSACTSVYPNTTKTFTVDLDVRLDAWGNYQRNAAHTGYVPVAYDTADFVSAWNVPADTSFTDRDNITAVVADRDQVFANFRQPTGRLATRAFASGSGARNWAVDLGSTTYFSAPSYANGRVLSVFMEDSSTNLPLPILDADSGSPLGTIFYASQYARPGAATMIEDQAFIQSGYFGNVLYGYDLRRAVKQWEINPLPPSTISVLEGQSLAADDNYVYFYAFSNLFVHSRSTGAVVKTIADPSFTRGAGLYQAFFGAPVLDGKGGIYSFSGSRFDQDPAPFIAFDFANGNIRWRTTAKYINAPALKDGKLYLPRAGSRIVDVLDTATGKVLNSIDVGEGVADLTSNVIATESHLFVGNGSKTFAIDLKESGNPVVWQTDRGGSLALSPNNMLLISARTGIYAYKLY